jgi:16S rRNA (guanine1207-N2)-methyltransferase
MDFVTDTLFAPLESGDVQGRGCTLFLGARPHPFLKNLDAVLWQPWRPYAEALPVPPMADIPDGPYDLALVRVPKQVDEAKYFLALALGNLAPGGALMVAAANDANGARLEKWLREAGMIPQAYTKNKARCVWARRPETLSPLVADWRRDGMARRVDFFGDGVELNTQPGLFSWDRADLGSRLLGEYLPATLSGHIADFGAGVGYLSFRLLQKARGIASLHVLEADARALFFALKNLENVRGDTVLHAYWADLTVPVAGLPPLDHIIMNPPFHEGRKTDPAIGQKFILGAAGALKKGGTLWMVANAHLPYEDTLRTCFKTVRPAIQSDGYKIIEAHHSLTSNH